VVRDERRGVDDAVLDEAEDAVHVGDDVGLAAGDLEALVPQQRHVDLDARSVYPDHAQPARAAREPDRHVQGVGMADGLDARIHAAAFGDRLDRRARVLLGQVDGLRSEALCHLEPLGHAVDRDDARRAGRLGHLDRAQPDRPEPEHRDGVAEPDLGRGDGVVARPEDVTGEQRRVVGDRLGRPAQRHVRVRDAHLLGLGPLEPARDLAVAEDLRVDALVERAVPAEEALPAGGHEAADDAIALGHLGRPVARGDDTAHELVPDREARLDGVAAVVDVQVRAADPRGLDPHDRVVGLLELGLGNVVDTNLADALEGHGLHWHAP
jgi:hypothetical protein